MSMAVNAPTELTLWPEEPPLAFVPDAEERVTERPIPPNWPGLNRAAEHVAVPTLTLVRPERPNGAAVLVYPGGGFVYLEIDKEGLHIANWLASVGITAGVVKYRTCPPSQRQERQPVPSAIWQAILADGLRAIRLLRHHATAWSVDPARVGIIGFSAGGRLVASLATDYDTADPLGDGIGQRSARPDAVAPIYPGIREDILSRIDAQTPPAFLCVANDDSLTPAEHCLRYYQACRAAGVAAELHIFRSGGHGFGLGKAGQAVTRWQELFIAWLQGLRMIP